MVKRYVAAALASLKGWFPAPRRHSFTITPGTSLPAELVTRYSILAGRLCTVSSTALIWPFSLSLSLDPQIVLGWLQAISIRPLLKQAVTYWLQM